MVLFGARCWVVGDLSLTLGALLLGPSLPVMLLAASVVAMALTAWLAWRRLVVKVGPNEALVRTGRGGMQCVMSGSIVVVPLVHNLIRVSLEPIRLTVDLHGEDAVFTRDKVRLNVVMAFTFRVPARADCVCGAARFQGLHRTLAETLDTLLDAGLERSVRNASDHGDFESWLAAPDELAKAAAREYETCQEDCLELVGVEVLDLALPAADTLRRDLCNQKTLLILESRAHEGNSRELPNADSMGATSPDGRCRP